MSVTSAPLAAFAIATMVGGAVLMPMAAQAEWWRSGPKDFEECADLAEKAATKAEKTASLADCNAKFAGRRKAGGGYIYYDFMQDRAFDLAGPNPTAEEQKKIDEEYTGYLAKQRRAAIASATAVKRQQQQDQQQAREALPPLPPPKQVQQLPVREASLRSEPPKTPPPPKSVKLQPPAVDARAPQPTCVKGEFSCDWPQLAEKWNGLKRLFGAPPPPAPAPPPPPPKTKRS